MFKMDPELAKKWPYFDKIIVFLKLIFRDESHFYANCLFYILTFYRQCLRFQFFNDGLHMHISILTGVQNQRISPQKTVIFCWKMFFLKLIFWDDGHFYANCLFYILAFYHKCLLFQFLRYGIRFHIPILTVVQKDTLLGWKMVIFP